MIIFVAGPYSAKIQRRIEDNVNAAIDAGIEILRKGHTPFIPHLTHLVDQRAVQTGIELDWSDFVRWSLAILPLCDAVLFLGSSPGADLELQKATSLGIPVFNSIDEIPEGDSPDEWPQGLGVRVPG